MTRASNSPPSYVKESSFLSPKDFEFSLILPIINSVTICHRCPTYEAKCWTVGLRSSDWKMGVCFSLLTCWVWTQLPYEEMLATILSQLLRVWDPGWPRAERGRGRNATWSKHGDVPSSMWGAGGRGNAAQESIEHLKQCIWRVNRTLRITLGSNLHWPIRTSVQEMGYREGMCDKLTILSSLNKKGRKEGGKKEERKKRSKEGRREGGRKEEERKEKKSPYCVSSLYQPRSFVSHFTFCSGYY